MLLNLTAYTAKAGLLTIKRQQHCLKRYSPVALEMMDLAA